MSAQKYRIELSVVCPTINKGVPSKSQGIPPYSSLSHVIPGFLSCFHGLYVVNLRFVSSITFSEEIPYS